MYISRSGEPGNEATLYLRTTHVAHHSWSNDGIFESPVVEGIVSGVVVVKEFRDIPLLVL